MSNRAGVTELATFVASIIQADQLGVTMAKVLRIQADQMRISAASAPRSRRTKPRC